MSYNSIVRALFLGVFLLWIKGCSQQYVAASVETIENFVSYVKTTVVETERNIIQEYLKDEALRIKFLKEVVNWADILSDVNKDAIKVVLESDKNIQYVLQVYRMQKQFLKHHKPITENKKRTQSNDSLTLEKMIKNRLRVLPNKKDLQSVVNGLLRIQTWYNLTWTDIFNGVINGKSSRQLTCGEILDILETIKPDSENGMLAFKHALTLLENNDKSRGLLDETVKEHYIDKLEHMLETLVRKKCFCSKESIQIYNILHTKNSTYINQISSVLHSCTRTYSMHNCKHVQKLISSHESVSSKYMSLCREATLKSPINKTRSKPVERGHHCKIVRINKAVLMFNPIKVEIIKDNPRIAILHDITGADDMILNSIRETVKQKSSSPVGDETKRSFSEEGIVMLLNDSDIADIKCFKQLRRRIIALAGTEDNMDVKSEVFNYGIGGFDGIAKADGSFDQGHRDFGRTCIFTVVLQLTNVDSGGYGVFPELGITVKLEQESALLYENKFRNGSRYGEHSSCPVLHGNKWTVNMCLGTSR